MSVPERTIDLNQHLLRGITKLIILNILKSETNEEGMSGYGLLQQVKSISKEQFVLKAGTIYPILDELVKSENIDLIEIDQKTSNRKKYRYKIAEKGILLSNTLLKEFSQFINNVDRFVMKE